jgi:hypothetical protein
MNKKDFIQALGVGVAFGLIIYCLMMVAVHFIDKNSESIITEPVRTPIETIPIRLHEELNPSREAIPIPVETPDADLAMVTFKYQTRMQDSYDNKMLERAESEESKKKEIPVSVTLTKYQLSKMLEILEEENSYGRPADPQDAYTFYSVAKNLADSEEYSISSTHLAKRLIK